MLNTSRSSLSLNDVVGGGDLRPTIGLEQQFRSITHSSKKANFLTQRGNAISKFSKDRGADYITRNALTPRCVGYINPKEALKEKNEVRAQATRAMRMTASKNKKKKVNAKL